MNFLFAFSGLIFCLYGLLFVLVGHYNRRSLLFNQKSTSKQSISEKSKRTSLCTNSETALTDNPIKFSILVPFRNEAKNLEELTESLNRLKFSKERFEVLFIDDHSEDNSIEILRRLLKNAAFTSSIIGLEKPKIQGKKQALNFGIQKAEHPWIVTLDADCIVADSWLQSIEESLINSAAEFLAGPVFLRPKKGLLFQLQASEFMALQALTKASYSKIPLLSNGANLVYSKGIFNAVSGFSGNLNISSGDDMFLMQKIWQYKNSKMAYIADFGAAVYTKASLSWQAYAAQQIRWLSKTSALKNPVLTWVALIVLLANATLVAWSISIVLAALIQSDYDSSILCFTGLLFGLKFTVDHLSLLWEYHPLKDPGGWSLSNISWPIQILASLIYPFWILSLALMSLFYKPQWKGRKIQIQ